MEQTEYLELLADETIEALTKKRTLSGGAKDKEKMKMILLDYLEEAWMHGDQNGWHDQWDSHDEEDWVWPGE